MREECGMRSWSEMGWSVSFSSSQDARYGLKRKLSPVSADVERVDYYSH